MVNPFRRRLVKAGVSSRQDIKLIKMNTGVSALPTPYFPLGTADLPLLKKSGCHENTEVSGNVCQSG